MPDPSANECLCQCLCLCVLPLQGIVIDISSFGIDTPSKYYISLQADSGPQVRDGMGGRGPQGGFGHGEHTDVIQPWLSAILGARDLCALAGDSGLACAKSGSHGAFCTHFIYPNPKPLWRAGVWTCTIWRFPAWL